jgi:RHS repeat-associated protein
MGHLFGSLGNDAKQTLGTAVDDGTHLVGDGLNAAGLTGAAHAVDTLGDQAGYHLGADVAELQLGQTDDPAQLVHGDPSAIRSSAGRLRAFSGAFGETARGLQGTDSAHWTGAAADAFRARFAPHPARWQDASSATGTAAGALESYAGAVESAQGQARQAVATYEQGQQATAQAQASYNAQVAAYNRAAQAYNTTLADGADPGRAPTQPEAFDDPGAALRQQAAQLLGDARNARDGAAASAADAIRRVTDLAPAEPSLASRLGDDVMDGLQATNLADISLAGGIVDGTADLVRLARTLDPLDQWNLDHPAEYVAGLSGTAAGLAEAGTDPPKLARGLAQGLVGTGWASDPFRAAGRLVPNVALAVGTDGGGTAADASGAAGRAAEGLGSEGDAAAAGTDGLAGNPAAAGRPPDDIPTAGDPVDVATGDVILSQTDLTLAGLLPLVVERMHRSSWRAGRWFGRSWASTFDQRLRVGSERVIGVFGDGRALIWPLGGASGGAPGGVSGGAGAGDGAEALGEAGVLPGTGAAWPLRPEPDGAWTVTDPQRGLTWRFEPHPAYFRSADGQGELPLAGVRDRAGHELTFSYDGTGQPTGINHSGGYQIQVVMQDGHVTALVADGAELIGYDYDEDGNLASVVNSSGRPLRFSYDPASRLTGWTDRNGYRYEYGYDGDGRCVRGDGSGQALSGTYRYEPDEQVTTWTDVAGAVTRYEISDGARVAAITSPLGHRTRWEHDTRGRVVACTDPLGRSTRYGYDQCGNLTTVIRPDGSQARADYDERNLPVRLTDPAGRAWAQEFDDRFGQVTLVTAPDGATTRFGYDESGHLASVTNPGGAVTRISCDAAGLPVEVRRAGGGVTRYERDGFGQVTRVTGPDGAATELAWTPEGRLASRTLPDGAAEYWDYDAEGNVVRQLSPGGGLTRYEYGPFDQPVAMTGPDGVRTEFGYDHGLRLISVRRARLTWSYGYDAAGRLVAETDYNRATTRYGYDPAGQLTSQVNACGQRVAFRHDQLGNVADRISGGTTTTFGYDLAGRLVYARNPDAEVWLDRDPCGRITAETCNGRTVSSGYDVAGRRRRRVTPFGAVADWDYDAAGQPVRLTAGEHEIRFGYDAAGREVRRELPGGLVLTQAWDQRGRLTLQALSGADGLAGVAGAAGMAGAAGLAGAVLQRRAYGYDCDGLVTGIEDLLGGMRAIGLDRGGRVTAVQGPDWSEQYAYDPAGNVAAAHWPPSGLGGGPGLGGPGAEAGPSGSGLGGSGGVAGRGGVARGGEARRGGEGQGPRRISGTLVTRAGNVRYRHDRQGRVVQRQVARISRKPDVWQYQWDASDRLTAVTIPGGTGWRYRYDPFGRRIARQRLGPDGAVVEQTDFTWDGPVLAEQSSSMVAGRGGRVRKSEAATGERGAGEDGAGESGGPVGEAGEDGGSAREDGGPAGEAGESGAGERNGWVVTWNYRPGSFTPLTQSEHIPAADLAEAPQEQIDRRFYAIVTDLVGSPTELTDPDGTLAGHQQHTLWGRTAWRGRADTPLRFPGQYADPETGLHYNQHRYYDPEVGAYLTPDPLGLAAAPNPHAYVMNPQVLADPLGLAPYAVGEVGVDTNSLIHGLDFGELDKLADALAGRSPVISPQALSEYLERGNAARLGDFLTAQGGRIGSQVSEGTAAALRAQANSLADQFGNPRALGVKDSFVIGSAMRDGVSLITGDRQVIVFLRAVGYSVEPFG